MDWRRLHACGKCHKDKNEQPRDLCSFCAAMATSPDKRSASMKTVIEGEQLQMEMFQLLEKIQSLVDTEAIQAILLQARSLGQ